MPLLAKTFLQIPSKNYNSIFYRIYVNSLDLEKGPLDHCLLQNNISAMCFISVANPDLAEYEYAVITLAYKHTKSKYMRYKKYLSNTKNAKVFYRHNKEAIFSEYLKNTTPESDMLAKPLLLNDIYDKSDASAGDSAIQLMVRFSHYDGSSTYKFYPGSALGELLSIIGLSVFEAQSVEEVIDEIICELMGLLKIHVLSNCNVSLTTALYTDIDRYMRFSIYGK